MKSVTCQSKKPHFKSEKSNSPEKNKHDLGNQSVQLLNYLRQEVLLIQPSVTLKARRGQLGLAEGKELTISLLIILEKGESPPQSFPDDIRDTEVPCIVALFMVRNNDKKWHVCKLTQFNSSDLAQRNMKHNKHLQSEVIASRFKDIYEQVL
ncbi:hypothetical protein A0J61_00663 [Choanephora cucurbitarum]|uniref:Uncharacterized protein n=1 Tax=Choanephora cucurbitarum TaxID=101091 RepID=A0A1C7NQ71_9FUNG|nr:hypothetical protein A0J61_00663 [Choanephora cucurbitarum]